MTLQQLLFDDTVDQVALVEDCGSNDLTFVKFGTEEVNLTTLTTISSNNGALCGGNLSAVKYVGDLENTISIGTAGAYIAKDMFKEGMPYNREYIDSVLVILPSYHFLLELRRQLSGEVLSVDSNFSPDETIFYNEYQEWVDGVAKTGEVLLAVEALDKWLIDELLGIAHPQLNRDYTSTHKWSKLEERVE